MMPWARILAVWLLATGLALPALAKPGDMSVTLMAARVDWSSKEFSGYAFMCVAVEGKTQDECYGFYPRSGNKGFAGGPGAGLSDFQKVPARFPTPAISVTRAITPAHRLAALKAIDTWNEKEFELSPLNCLELMRTIVQATGFYVPPKKKEDSNEFLKRLKNFNP